MTGQAGGSARGDSSAREAGRAAKRGRARLRTAFVEERSGSYDRAALDAALAARLSTEAAAGTGARAFPTQDAQRWVPIGPSVVRRGLAENRPRVSGRVRDLAVDAAGQRAYAATAKGGVWYTADAGATWRPVGGYTDRTAARGGNLNAQSCGCLLVAFDTASPADPARDVVLVGTGELAPWVSNAGASPQAGLGVLSAVGPAARAEGEAPWEPESGLAQLEGLGVYRLARSPGRTAGATGTAPDLVVAATSAGLFLGTRTEVPGPPSVQVYRWVRQPGIDALVLGAGPPAPPAAAVTDVLWLPGGANGRIVAVGVDRSALHGVGGAQPTVVGFSDDLGVSFAPVTGLGAAAGLVGRASLAPAGTTGRVYVLGEVAGPPAAAALWQVSPVAATPPVATTVPGLPAAADLWGGQRDYDQAIAVDVPPAGPDRVYVGGSTVRPVSQWSASLWAYDVGGTAAAPTLVAAPGVSRTGDPPGGDGADRPGLVGNTVHADVHALRLAGPTGAQRQVWVGCDGGVFVSDRAGRVNSFGARVTGLAALEAGFVATHPTSSHFVAAGFQDNGTEVRVGDTVWEATFPGDGGGTVFHPVHSQYVVTQWTGGAWYAQPAAGYVDPLTRSPGGPDLSAATFRREGDASRPPWTPAFYSAAAAVRRSATAGRIALGTDRVWVTDDLGTAAACSWRALPSTTGAATDPRPNGTDAPLVQVVGVPPGGLGQVFAVRWASSRRLIALYAGGVVVYTSQANGTWTVAPVSGGAGGPSPATTTFTDVVPVPEREDAAPPAAPSFYLLTTGEREAPAGSPDVPAVETAWFYDGTATPPAYVPTGLRAQLAPVDPAYCATVQPGTPTVLHVGTVTGVWRGERTPGSAGPPPVPATHGWKPFVNGLPPATVQDLAVWHDPAAPAGSPVLLRAAVQARGVWEVDVAAAAEPSRTYLRVHERDDRRRLPVPLANPRRRPSAPPVPVSASPDVVVRPRWPLTTAPGWQLGAAGAITASSVPAYQLWTFQTAFRWLYPSVAADGQWTDALGDLVALHRSVLGLPAGRRIDRPLWNAVVGGTRLSAPTPTTAAVTTAAGDPLAVYRPPWHTLTAATTVATEIDLLESVRPTRVLADTWQVYAEPSTVDVLVHHRDTRAVAAGDAWVALLWRSGPSASALLGADLSGLPALAASLLTGAPGAAPGGWTLATDGAGSALHRLPVPVDARLPRAASVDVDLSGVTPAHAVLLVAVAGSTADPLSVAPAGAPTSVAQLVRAWPYAAARVLRAARRPAGLAVP